MKDTAEPEESVDLGALTGSLGFMLRMAQLQVFDLFFQRLAAHDMKPGEFTVLWVIAENPGLRQGTIARELRIKPAHMTKLIRRMVAAGFVARTVPENDRRSVRLSLTAPGAAFVEKNRGAFLDLHAAERARLSDGETAQLLALLGKLTGLGSKT